MEIPLPGFQSLVTRRGALKSPQVPRQATGQRAALNSPLAPAKRKRYALSGTCLDSGRRRGRPKERGPGGASVIWLGSAPTCSDLFLSMSIPKINVVKKRV